MTEGLRTTGGALVSYIRTVLGTYTPLTDSSGNIITTSAGIDWEYLITALILIMFLYFFLKFVTLIFK